MRVWFGLSTVALILMCKEPLHAKEICCVPDQFEGTAYLGYGIAIIDRTSGASRKSPRTAYSYINGTVALSYDYTNKRLLLNLVGTEVSPLLPKPESYNSIYLSDFGKDIMYQVGADGSCQKSSLEQNMTRQCIVSGGTEFGFGFLAGGETGVADYKFDVKGSLSLKITASVIKVGDDCWPVSANFIPDSGLGSRDGQSGVMYNFDLVDTSRGIRNPTVFKPPPQCNGIPFTKKYTHNMDPFRFILHQFGLQ